MPRRRWNLPFPNSVFGNDVSRWGLKIVLNNNALRYTDRAECLTRLVGMLSMRWNLRYCPCKAWQITETSLNSSNSSVGGCLLNLASEHANARLRWRSSMVSSPEVYWPLTTNLAFLTYPSEGPSNPDEVTQVRYIRVTLLYRACNLNQKPNTRSTPLVSFPPTGVCSAFITGAMHTSSLCSCWTQGKLDGIT